MGSQADSNEDPQIRAFVTTHNGGAVHRYNLNLVPDEDGNGIFPTATRDSTVLGDIQAPGGLASATTAWS